MFRNLFAGSILELFCGKQAKSHCESEEKFKELVRELCDYAQVTYASIEDYDIPQEVIDAVPAGIASQYSLIPLQMEKDRLLVAMVNPLDMRAVEELQRLTQRKVDIVVTTYSDFEVALHKYYADCSCAGR